MFEEMPVPIVLLPASACDPLNQALALFFGGRVALPAEAWNQRKRLQPGV
jgi:hypothetical protein